MTERLTREAMLVSSEIKISPEVLQKLGDLEPKLGEDGTSVTLGFDKHNLSYHQALVKVMDSGLQISSIQPVDNRLERVFLELTRGTGAS